MSRRQRRTRAKQARHLPTTSRRLGTVSGVALAASLLSGGIAEADTYQVNSTSDDAAKTTCDGTVADGCSLRGAILDANANSGVADTITFASTVTGTITLGGTRLPDITDQLDVQGPGADVLTISGNDASGIFYEDNDAPLSISGLTLSHGYSQPIGGLGNSDEGGAVRSDGAGSLTLLDMTIDDSRAFFGGGIVKENGPLVVRESTIYLNSASAYVGGIGTVNSTVTIADSTVSGNSATPGGADGAAGIAAYYGDLTVENSTVTGNDGGSGSGGVYAKDINPSLYSSIVAGNTGATSNDVRTETGTSGAGTFVNAKYSLIGDSSGFTLGGNSTDNILDKDPLLGPLADNGGPTPTHKPAGNSPVIDKGKNYNGTGNDQRGMPIYDDPSRANTVDGRDIGAVELQAGDVIPAPPPGSNGPADPAPVVTALSPSSGTGGTSVGISGKNFEHATQVLFGTTPATFAVDSFEHITAAAPGGLTGAVDVTVVNGSGGSANTAADQFTFVAPASPAVTPPASPPASPEVICRSVPNLLRHTLHGVRQLLKSHGCSDVPLTHKGHAKHPPSHVKSQSVAPGTTMHEGDRLKLKLH
jgi:hypothetical protein